MKISDKPILDVSDASQSDLLNQLKDSLAVSLQIGDRVSNFTLETRLLGDLPELDSMAILTVLVGLEERFGIDAEDDELSAETFETVGSLLEFLRSKLHR